MCRNAAATPPVPKFVRRYTRSTSKGLPMWRATSCRRGWRARPGKAPLCVPSARFTWARRHHLNEPALRPLLAAPNDDEERTLTKSTFILLGGGLASAIAASTLRAEGFDGRVIIVGDENHPPYSRPPLSKDVLRGEKSPERTWLRPPAWYASKDIELQLGVRAVAVDPHAHRVELAGGAAWCVLPPQTR